MFLPCCGGAGEGFFRRYPGNFVQGRQDFPWALAGVTHLEPHWKAVKRNSQKACETSLESSGQRAASEKEETRCGGLGARCRGRWSPQ